MVYVGDGGGGGAQVDCLTGVVNRNLKSHDTCSRGSPIDHVSTVLVGHIWSFISVIRERITVGQNTKKLRDDERLWILLLINGMRFPKFS